MEPTIVKLDDTKIPVFQTGHGEPLVLFHGYVGSHLTWRHQVKAYSEHFRVVTFDWLGWGASGRNTTLDYSYGAEVVRCIRLLDILGLDRVHYVGHDYGGFLGIGLAQAFPDRLRSFVIASSRAHCTWRPHWYVILRLMTLLARTSRGRKLYRSLPLKALHRFFMRRELRTGTFTPDVFDYHCRSMDDTAGADHLAAFYRDYQVAALDELRDGLSRMTTPTMILWGARNPFLSPDIARDLACHIPRAELRIYAEGHHFLSEEMPGDFLADTVPFLLKHRA